MALGMTKLSNVTIISACSVVASATEWASDNSGTVLNAGTGDRFSNVNLQISVTFGTASGDALLHIRKSANDGTTENTTQTYARTIGCDSGNTVVITHPVYDFDYLDIGIENEDASATLTWSAIYEGVKITGMD